MAKTIVRGHDLTDLLYEALAESFDSTSYNSIALASSSSIRFFVLCHLWVTARILDFINNRFDDLIDYFIARYNRHVLHFKISSCCPFSACNMAGF